VSLEDASRALAMFKELNVPILGVVENMSYLELPDGTRLEVFGKGGGAQLAEMAGVPLIGMIPLDPTVRAGGDEGRPVVVSNPDSAAAKALVGVSEKVAALLSVAALQQTKGISLNMVG
jgi:ATP-binding protein involved in chromosome partitioning